MESALDLARHRPGLARRSLTRRERLYRSGDALQSLYLVSAGALKTITLAEDGTEQVLAFHLPGEVVGVDALATGQHRCEAIALVPCTLHELPFATLLIRAAEDASLQRSLCRAIGQSANRDQDHLSMLIRRQASGRIAQFLLGLRERSRRADTDLPLMLPMSREDIGRFLGLALETVSRTFTRLQDDGVIAVSARRIEIRDELELQRLARQG
jgi:CRP/FNR family transcriptional regulator